MSAEPPPAASPAPASGAASARRCAATGEESRTGGLTPRRSRRLLLLALPVLALLAVGGWYAFPRGPSDDLAAMQGDWVLKGADGRDRAVVRIAGDVWTYRVGDEERGRLRIALNPDAAPREIDLTVLEPDGRPRTFTRGAVGVEMKEVGVYELRGDELRIAKAPAWHGGTRPRALSESQTPAQTLFRVPR